MSWLHVVKKANAALNQEAEDKLEDRIPAKVELEQAVAAAQQHTDEIVAACTNAVSQGKQAHMRLDRSQAAVDRLTRSTQAAVDAAAAQPDKADAFTQQAQAFAGQLATAREQLAADQHTCEMADQLGQQATLRAQEAREALQEAQNNAHRLEGKMAQGEMEKAMADSAAKLNAVSGGIVPNLDQVEAKIDRQFADAQASEQVGAASGAVSEMDVHHAELQASAQSILSEFTPRAAVTAGAGA